MLFLNMNYKKAHNCICRKQIKFIKLKFDCWWCVLGNTNSMNFLQRQFVHEIPHGDHEISHAETMRYLLVPWEISPWDHLMVSREHLRVSPCDFSLYQVSDILSVIVFAPPPTTRGSRGLMVPWDISCYHEISHGLIVRILLLPWDISWSYHRTRINNF